MKSFEEISDRSSLVIRRQPSRWSGPQGRNPIGMHASAGRRLSGLPPNIHSILTGVAFLLCRLACSEASHTRCVKAIIMFANQLKAWQDALALNLRLRNPQANADETNAAAQRMILHLLFVRLCKDRGIGDSGQLLLPSLHLPGQPEFAVLPIETLGQAYEELVGHDGHLSAPANGLSKAKPNFKKAAGIYYTPSYIVKHIVRGTIGRLCHGKTPRQIAGLRVLDPACGTGSFLLGAYEYLLDWHREWYVRGWPPRHAAELYRGKDGQWRLTVRERQRILISNIYGVDIDPQAVEIARLSLLLKAMDEPGANVA